MPKSYGKFAHIDAMALRISRLDAAGGIARGSATGAYLLCSEGRITTTPTVETGGEITRGGFRAGQVCNAWQTPDRVSGYAGELVVCNMSDEMLELLGTAEALSASVALNGAAAAQVIGSVYYETGTCDLSEEAPGVTLEMWSRPVLCKSQVLGGAAGTSLMWRKKVVPYAYNFVPTAAQDPTGDAFPDYTFSFKMKPAGPAWGDGPFGEDTLLNPAVGKNTLAPAQTWTAVEYWTSTAPPTCPAGSQNYVAIPA